jgi:hypothetical protein
MGRNTQGRHKGHGGREVGKMMGTEKDAMEYNILMGFKKDTKSD